MTRRKNSSTPAECKNLRAKEVENMALQTLQGFFQLDLGGSCYQARDIWEILVTASIQKTSIEGACSMFDNSPSPNTVRSHLKGFLPSNEQLSVLETQLNQLLLSHLPPNVLGKAYPTAIDMTLIPYHGEHKENDPHIKRSQAKGGTTHFHCYATLYLTKKNKRYTLGLTFVRAGEKALDVLKRLLLIVRAQGWRCRRLCLDREFDNNAVIAFLKQQPFPSIIPLKVTGKKGGTRALLSTPRSGYKTYHRKSAQYGEQTFRVCVVRKYSKGRYKKSNVKTFGYVAIGHLRMEPRQVFEVYRKRFGIESSYRQMNSVRARTSSKSPNIRFFFMGLAFFLLNLWNALKWTFLRKNSKTVSTDEHKLFPLRLFCLWILEVIKKRKPLKLHIFTIIDGLADYWK